MDTNKNHGWDHLAKVNKLPFSYILFCFIPNIILKINTKIMESAHRFAEQYHRDYNNEEFQVFSSGSAAEGLGVSPSLLKEGHSDLDIMIARTFSFTVDDSCPDLHPGYARLIVDDPDAYETMDGDGPIYLSSSAVMGRNILKDSNLPMSFSGPAVQSDMSLDPYLSLSGTDFVKCVPCYDWPKQAEEWVHRPRPSGWPSHTLIQTICSEGCHFVPVAHVFSTAPDIEWRFSFSRAEVLLAKSLNASQKHCYILFKLLCKHVTGKTGILKTYYLKNVMFYCCEQLSTEFWKPVNFAECLFALLDCLINFLNKKEIPQYFIKNNNLISQVDEKEVEKIRKKISFLRRKPINAIIEWNALQKNDFTLKEPLGFENVFRGMLDICLSPDSAHLFLEEICKTEKRQSFSYSMDGKHIHAVECFKNGLMFFGNEESISGGCMWQSNYVSFLREYWRGLPITSLISALVFLTNVESWAIDTMPIINNIKSVAESRLTSAFYECSSNRIVRSSLLLFYSVFLIMTGRFDEAYLHAKRVLDEEIDMNQQIAMHTAIALDKVIFEEMEPRGGIHGSPVSLYALYLVVKCIKKAKYHKERNDILRAVKNVVKVQYSRTIYSLMIALIYMETDQFVHACEYFCLAYIRSVPSTKVKQNILVCLILELLQMSTSTILQYKYSDELKDSAKRSLELTIHHLQDQVDSLYDIGQILSSIAAIYEKSSFDEICKSRFCAAQQAAVTCYRYHNIQAENDEWSEYLRGT